MLRGAIIGLGNVALAGHLPGWLRCRDVEIVAATDVEPARRAAIEALVRANVPGGTELLSRMLRDDDAAACHAAALAAGAMPRATSQPGR